MNSTDRQQNFNIVVCVKQVPGAAQAKLDPVTKTLVRSAAGAILNPYDGFAVEAALEIRDDMKKEYAECGCRITALSMGIPSVEHMLTDLCARGADSGVLMTDRAFAGADTLDTSYTLSLGVREIEKTAGNVDLVICGHMAVDGDTAQIGPELAQSLGIPHISNVLKIVDVNPVQKTMVVESIAAEGRQTLKVSLPALITVSKDINVPRLPSIAGIRKAAETRIRILSAEGIGADPDRIGKKGAATQVVRTFTPDFTVAAEKIQGTPKQTAARVRDILEAHFAG